MRAVAAVGIVAALLVAGCSGPDPDAGGPGDGGPTPDASLPGLALPEWSVGRWWTYGIEVGDTRQEGATTYAVTADLGTDWQVDTDDPERAFQDARSDISRLGPQRKADLAGSQGDDRVQFFRWPLQAGSNWTTTWDGQDVAVTVDHDDGSGADLTARNATQVVYTYRYDAAAGWFGRLDRHGPDGDVVFSLVLLQSGASWSGTAVRWTLHTLVEGSGAPGAVNFGLSGYPGLQVAAGTTDLWLSYSIPCQGQGGGYTVQLRPDDGAGQGGYDSSGPCQATQEFRGVAVEGPTPGGWTLLFSFGSAPTPDGLTFELLARTLVEVPVGG